MGAWELPSREGEYARCGCVASVSAHADRCLCRGSSHGSVHTALLNAVDPATIDAIVITSMHNMLALPYVTESPAGFRGVVLATGA